MAIPEFSTGLLRKQIGFVRVIPDEARDVLKKRGYECYLLEEAALKDFGQLGTTDSVVLTQTPEKPYQVRQDLKRFANLLNHDCRLYVRYARNAADLKNIVLRTLNRLKLPPSGLVVGTDAKLFGGDWFEGTDAPIFGPFVHILQVSDDWDSLANLIASNPAGRWPNVDLDINICNAKRQPFELSEEDNLLLRRAFWDCSSVHLVGKMNGLSGVNAFEAFARLRGNVVGSDWPCHYFVKLGDRIKVAREFDKYGTTALDNVPYHLGPRLRLDRCVLGRSKGLIVSDYVVGAEALRDCARDGRGIPVIGNLFNQTLIAWRRAARNENLTLRKALESQLREEMPEHRKPLIRAYGATKTCEKLKDMFDARSMRQVLTGVVHGDLHATNVLVRMNDAVIIDLEKIETGMPLLLDAASLEGGLFVDGFIHDQRSAEEVLLSIQPLYTAAGFDRDDNHCQPSDASAWFVDSVRQIRMQARQMERQPRQYAWTLAAVLLKKSCVLLNFQEENDTEAPNAKLLTREDVRAMAYVLAERILVDLSKEGDQPVHDK